MQILFQHKKSNKPTAEKGTELPDIQKIINNLVALFDKRRDEILSKIDTLREKGTELTKNFKAPTIKFGKAIIPSSSSHSRSSSSSSSSHSHSSSSIDHISIVYIFVVSIDLAWEVELGNCEIAFIDRDLPKPKGMIRVSNTEQLQKMAKSYMELEGQFINNKLLIAQTQMEKDEFQHRVKVIY